MKFNDNWDQSLLPVVDTSQNRTNVIKGGGKGVGKIPEVTRGHYIMCVPVKLKPLYIVAIK